MEQQHSNSFTFNVDKVELNKESPDAKLLKSAQAILIEQGTRVDNSEDFSHRGNSEENFLYCNLPGIISAIHMAYSSHYALKLSVSDFIILIGQALGRHIEANAEKLRHHFVNHEGKQTIEIQRDEFVKGQQNDWSTVFGEFAEEIKKRVKADVHGVIIDDTSVATQTTRIVSEITLMDAMKSYFSYNVSTMCGIPQITLEGTPEDWKKLQEKVNKLVEMNKDDCLELKWWLDGLVPVVEKICEAGIQRKIDVDFWSTIYKYIGGSGGSDISGWITMFFPYLANGWQIFFAGAQIQTREIPKQICNVPFTWNYLGEDIPMTFCGGFLGAEFDRENFTLKPAHFWSVNYNSP